MWLLVLLAAVVGTNSQYAKNTYSGVKGGYTGQHQYNAGLDQTRYFGYNGTQGHYGGGSNNPSYEEQGVGVCFIEVPTASLARDPAHVPAGNGSRSDLSRIRSCCKGYIRNIHNYRLCDPVCTQECVNALCSAPEICTCFPDHVKNAAGFCIPTCPIGCQNGRCAGGECICKDGFKLDRDSKYCAPNCQDNCGGLGFGNCTAPNTCTCKSGYESTTTGSCRPVCASGCKNGDCVAPNECRCKHGYSKDNTGVCGPFCSQSCGPNGHCISPNVCSNSNTPTPSNYQPYQPYNPNGQNGHHYYPNDSHRPMYNFSSDSQLKPNYTVNPYNPIDIIVNGPNGPNGYPLNQTYPTSHGPYQPNTQSNPNQPTNYYPYNPSQPGQYPNNPSGQPGQYPNNPSGQPGQYSNNPSGQPGQSPYNPSGQPGQYPNNPSGQQGQYPNNPSGQPGQYQGYNTNQYQYGNEELVPRCSQPCINGFCVEGNRCSCNSGYELDNTDPSGTRCRPHCAGGCENGVCSAPNFCICNMGFRKEHGVKGATPRCVKRMKRSTN